MKRYCLCMVILLILSAALPALADGEIIINVVDGNFVSGGETIPLADVAHPIEVGVLNGEVIVRVMTLEGGVREMNLGRGQLALADQAVAYVGILPEEELTGALPDEGEICEICGRSTSFGYHKTLDCGHYGCLMTLDHLRICSTCGKFTCDSKDHTPCEHCGVGWCSHNDLECEYTRNPAPTPFTTQEPTGKITYFVLEEDGTMVQGNPSNSAPPEWSPGPQYVKEHTPLEMQNALGGTSAGSAAAGGVSAGGASYSAGSSGTSGNP